MYVGGAFFNLVLLGDPHPKRDLGEFVLVFTCDSGKIRWKRSAF